MCLKPQNYKRTAHLQYLAKMTVKHCMEVMELSFEKKDRMNDQSYLTLTKFLKFHYEEGSKMTNEIASLERRGRTLDTEWVEGAVETYDRILEALHRVYMNLTRTGGDGYTLTTLPDFSPN